MDVGVLALQGEVAAHLSSLEALGARARPVRTPTELERVDALVMPGGESTTMWMLAQSSGCAAVLKRRLADGLPTLGTCAGMIMLATEVLDGRADQGSYGAIDISVRRNAFGRQLASFEADLEVATMAGGPFRGVFIRAPWIERVGDDVEVLASVAPGPAGLHDAKRAPGEQVAVLCVSGRVLVSSFHPELSGDLRVHELFVERCVRGG